MIRPDDSDRLAQGIGEGRFERVHRLAVNLGRQSGVIAQNVDDHGHIDVARFEDRLAVVESLELGKFVDVLLDKIGQLPDQPSAFGSGHLSPRAGLDRQTPAGGSDRPIDVRRGGFGDLSQDIAVAGLMVSNVFEPSTHWPSIRS